MVRSPVNRRWPRPSDEYITGYGDGRYQDIDAYRIDRSKEIGPRDHSQESPERQEGCGGQCG